jgi:hypothetical protein
VWRLASRKLPCVLPGTGLSLMTRMATGTAEGPVGTRISRTL